MFELLQRDSFSYLIFPILLFTAGELLDGREYVVGAEPLPPVKELLISSKLTFDASTPSTSKLNIYVLFGLSTR